MLKLFNEARKPETARKSCATLRAKSNPVFQESRNNGQKSSVPPPIPPDPNKSSSSSS